MHRLPAAIQGYQRATSQLRPQEAKRVLEKAIKQIKAHPSPKDLRSERLRGVVQGVQREQFHSGGRYPASGKALFGQAYEPWSEDMACILQGSCLPGSTKYCRTKSMFGKLDVTDIMQGTTKARAMSTFAFPLLPINGRGLHTLAHSQQQSGTVVLSAATLRAPCHFYSTDTSPDVTNPPADATAKLTQREKLKQAVRDYGSTVVVFHISISLMSLGAFYLAVSSGLDVQALLTTLGFSSDFVASRIASGTSTFLLSYAIYKVFAPVRIAVTLTCTPFIVRYLRNIGFLKVKSLPVSK